MRTPLSRARPRRTGAIIVFLVVALVASVVASGLASANTSSRSAAKLKLSRANPTTVTGTGFKPRTRVRVTLVATETFVRNPVANAQGAFTATFPTVVDRCSSWSVSASQPGRATVVLRGAKPECPPA